jgi:hypothetical protein
MWKRKTYLQRPNDLRIFTIHQHSVPLLDAFLTIRILKGARFGFGDGDLDPDSRAVIPNRLDVDLIIDLAVNDRFVLVPDRVLQHRMVPSSPGGRP